MESVSALSTCRCPSFSAVDRVAVGIRCVFRTLALGVLCLGLATASASAESSAGYSAAVETPDAPDAESSFDFDADPLFDDDFDFDLDDALMGPPDPFERPNRGILVFNQVVDSLLLDPITQVYRHLLPEQLRRSINRFFDNINSTQIIANDIFQLEWKDVGISTARLVINSTAGIGGLFDPAARWGLERHLADFGQTLAIAGAPSGPYFMLPLLGPTTVRDGIGIGVDAFLHPTFFLLGGADLLFFTGSAGLTERARHFEELKALEEGSIDFYAALRSGYYQNREAEIWERREDRRPAPDIEVEADTEADAELEPDAELDATASIVPKGREAL